MTVCISAMSSEHIVMVSDTKLTTGYYSQDIGTLKLRSLHPKWKVMIAGKFGHSKPIIDSIRERIPQNRDISVEEAAKACKEAFIDYGRVLAADSVLSPYGLTIPEFVQSRDQLGDSLYERIWGDIQRIQVGCDLLVSGFDLWGRKHIFTVSNPTTEQPTFISYFDDPGFTAIGTGGLLAESALYAFQQGFTTSLEATLYHTTFAKFVAESATDVGDATYVFVMTGEGTRLDIGVSAVNALRQRYLTEGRPSIPNDAAEIIRKAVASAPTERVDF